MQQLTLNVKGMHCNSCKMLVEDALIDIGATNVFIFINEKKQMGKVSTSHADKSKVIEAIEKEGYKVIA